MSSATARPGQAASKHLGTPSTTRDWRDRARCLTSDPELFFPTGTTGPAETQIEEAKAVCARCPVTAQCLQWAMGAGSQADFGVWGGLTEEERRSLRRRRRTA